MTSALCPKSWLNGRICACTDLTWRRTSLSQFHKRSHRGGWDNDVSLLQGCPVRLQSELTAPTGHPAWSFTGFLGLAGTQALLPSPSCTQMPWQWLLALQLSCNGFFVAAPWELYAESFTTESKSLDDGQSLRPCQFFRNKMNNNFLILLWQVQMKVLCTSATFGLGMFFCLLDPCWAST